MSASPKPGFPPLQLEEFDARLDAEAARRGIPTLTTPARSEGPRPQPKPDAKKDVVTPPADPTDAAERPAKRRPTRAKTAPKAPEDNQPTPRSRMKSLNVELPDYVWVELKSRAAREMVSVRHVIMRLLKDAGIEIAAADLIEDGRRLR
ncbi:MAG TPA: hypothetical protein PLW75_02215 [Hyphomicrobium sp.]|nr:hypothetical protein [Hyphomicrobium sp.]